MPASPNAISFHYHNYKHGRAKQNKSRASRALPLQAEEFSSDESLSNSVSNRSMMMRATVQNRNCSDLIIRNQKLVLEISRLQDVNR
jgi:hypothetical protein